MAGVVFLALCALFKLNIQFALLWEYMEITLYRKISSHRKNHMWGKIISVGIAHPDFGNKGE